MFVFVYTQAADNVVVCDLSATLCYTVDSKR